MKLITHNMLTSKGMKNVVEGFPLKIKASDIRTIEVDYNPEFLMKMIPKLDWPAFKFAAQCVGHGDDVPDVVPTSPLTEEDVLKNIHHVLMEVEVVNGYLECPESKRQFPITNGIPNMLLNEDEV